MLRNDTPKMNTQSSASDIALAALGGSTANSHIQRTHSDLMTILTTTAAAEQANGAANVPLSTSSGLISRVNQNAQA